MRFNRDERGFTLVELLIATVVGTTLLGAVGASFMLAFRATSGVDVILAESHDNQLLATTLSADLQSVSESGVDTSAASPSGCAGASPGENILRLQWSETMPSVSISFSASYRYLQDGSEWQLVRYFCEGSVLASASAKTTVVAHELSPTVKPTAVGSGVDRGLQLTLASGYTFTITGTRRTPASTSTSTSTTVPPTLRTLQSASIRDNNLDGKVEQIVATFNGVLNASCASGWSSSVSPTVGTLGAVTVSGSSATISVTPGTTHDTAWKDVTVSIAPSGGCNAAAGTVTRTDVAAPVILDVDSAGATPGLIQTTDTMTFTLSEPVTGVPASGEITETDKNRNPDELSIAGLLSGATDMGSTTYVDRNGNDSSASFAGVITHTAGVIRVVVGASTCALDCASIGAGTGTMTFSLHGAIKDPAGQTVVPKTLTSFEVF